MNLQSSKNNYACRPPKVLLALESESYLFNSNPCRTMGLLLDKCYYLGHYVVTNKLSTQKVKSSLSAATHCGQESFSKKKHIKLSAINQVWL